MHVGDLHLFGWHVTVAAVVFVASLVGGIIKCWSRGGMKPEWSTPTRLRYQADAGRIMAAWFWAGGIAMGLIALVAHNGLVALQAACFAFPIWVATSKERILTQQAIEAERYLAGEGHAVALRDAGVPPEVMRELGVDTAELTDGDLVDGELVDEREVRW